MQVSLSLVISAGLICTVFASSASQAYISDCSLEEARTHLKLNESSGQYFEVQSNRLLVESVEHDSDYIARARNEWVATLFDERFLQSEAGRPTLIEVRPCACFHPNETNLYCPSFLQECESYHDSSTKRGTVQCFGDSPYRNGLRRIMFLGVLWTIGIVGMLLFSSYGIQIINMILSVIIPNYNNYLANRIIRKDLERAQRLMVDNLRYRRRMRRRQPGSDPEWRLDVRAVRQLRLSRQLQQSPKAQRPVVLRLKVRVYRESERMIKNSDVHSDDDSDDDESLDECAICYQELRTGDRVGDIPCGHIFHSDCLKHWCVRRNACPYCQRADIAKPQLRIATQEDGNEASANPAV